MYADIPRGTPPKPPALLAMVTLLQAYEQKSDFICQHTMSLIIQSRSSSLVKRPLEALGRLISPKRDVSLAKLLGVTAQLGLLLVVMHLFQVEENFGLLRITPLIFAGFIIHAWLPLRLRLPFFLFLSVGAILTVLGLKQGLGLVGLGLGLIAICHLPLAFAARVGLLLGAGGILVALRAGWIETLWESLPTLVLPVLGAMFMFRLIIYLYDLRHEKQPATLWERLSYFFMLPNVCFLLFPVVDYQSFRRTYYNAEAAQIYQKGVLWMYRGVVHLLLYRLVYYQLIPAPAEIETLSGVVQSIITTYLLYLRISGQFHLIVGIMCLFGFNLPETHHLYYLASSFNDYWRRINIYWKDFMMKIFYYPSLMHMRRWGMTTALVGATLLVFFGTWLLHSYQWFWLRGTFPLTAPDALFWGILGVLVVVNSLYEAKRSRKRTLGKKEWSLRGALVLSLKTVGMFVFISVLWSLWSSPSVGAWVVLMSQAGNSGAAAFGILLLVLTALVGTGVLIQLATSRGWELTLVGSNPTFRRSAMVTSAGVVFLLVLGLPQVQGQLGGEAAEVVASLREQRLNQQDETLMEHGYYEGLLNAEKYTSELWTVQDKKPETWEGLGDTDATRKVNDIRINEFIPMADIVFREVPLRTNRWGMRDKNYELKKPSSTFRIALLGPSYVMGAGVKVNETFQWLVEERLNAEKGSGKYNNYEILNFAFGGYGLLQQVIVVGERVFAFEPDAAFYVVHQGEMERTIHRLGMAIRAGTVVKHDYLREIIQQSGVTPDMSGTEIERRLSPFAEQLVRWGYEQIAGYCREHGATPVLVFLPTTVSTNKGDFVDVSRYARDAGFSIFDLDGVYGNRDKEEIQLAPWDSHPNVLGHQLIADRLYQVLLENDRLGLGLTPDVIPASDQP